jgi:pantetheine-phosphate adenylyltransferase
MTLRTALFAGTFDPVTFGHLDVVARAARLFDRLVVAVAATGKATLLSVAERVELVRAHTAALPSVTVLAFDGLLVEFARRQGATVLVRGVRSYQDWEYELRMMEMNRHLAPDVETVFLAPSAEHAFVSSTLVREVAALGGVLTGLVPPDVAGALVRRFPPSAR